MNKHKAKSIVSHIFGSGDVPHIMAVQSTFNIVWGVWTTDSLNHRFGYLFIFALHLRGVLLLCCLFFILFFSWKRKPTELVCHIGSCFHDKTRKQQMLCVQQIRELCWGKTFFVKSTIKNSKRKHFGWPKWTSARDNAKTIKVHRLGNTLNK